MRELLLPDTDAGVLVQAVVLAGLAAVAVAAAWRRAELRVLAIGVTLVAAGLIGVRALH